MPVQRIVRSESRDLKEIIAILKQSLEWFEAWGHWYAIKRTEKALKLAEGLQAQASEGYHKNPYTPFRVVGEIGDDVHSVAYRHAKDGKLYKHDFEPGSARVIAVERHGKRELLVTGDVPLWDDF